MATAEQTQSIPQAGTLMAQRPAWLDTEVYPFASHFISIEGNRIHYIDEGSGPVMIFLHGAPAWSFLYRDIIKGLRGRFRCIALDWPGFGLSEPAADYEFSLMGNSRLLERFIYKLGLANVTLMVHDSAGSIGLGLVGRQPELFRAAIVSNCFAWPLDDYPSVKRFIKVVASPIFGFLITRLNFLTRYFVRGVAGGRLSKSERQGYLGATATVAQRRQHHQLFKALLSNPDYLMDVERRLQLLRDFPILLTFGNDDAAYKAGWMQRFEHMFPNHRTFVVEGGDHFPQEDDPQGIVNAIINWWDTDIAK